LLAEIESLLDAHASAGSFAARPAIDVLSASEQFARAPAAQEIAAPPSAFAAGERLGPHQSFWPGCPVSKGRPVLAND
jgi:hypothetical protein